MMKNNKLKYNFMLLLTAMIWGFAFVAQVEGGAFIGPFTMNATRFALGAIVLIPVVLFFERGRSERKERLRTVLYSFITGAVLFCASTLQQIGLNITGSAGVAGFITALYTVFVPIMCMVLFKSKMRFNMWLGVFCALLGLFLLCYVPGEGFSVGLGEILLFVGSWFWTAHVMLIDRLGKHVRSVHYAWGQFVTCAALSFVCMLMFEEPAIAGIYSARYAILYCGVFSAGVAYTLQVVAQKRADPTFAAIAFSSESVFSAIGGALFGIDNISLIGYIGCAFITFGIIIAQLVFDGKKKNKASDGVCEDKKEHICE